MKIKRFFRQHLLHLNAEMVTNEKTYKRILIIKDFTDVNDVDGAKEYIRENYNRIKIKAKQIMENGIQHTKNDLDP